MYRKKEQVSRTLRGVMFFPFICWGKISWTSNKWVDWHYIFHSSGLVKKYFFERPGSWNLESANSGSRELAVSFPSCLILFRSIFGKMLKVKESVLYIPFALNETIIEFKWRMFNSLFLKPEEEMDCHFQSTHLKFLSFFKYFEIPSYSEKTFHQFER